jgi:hypothetical protein
MIWLCAHCTPKYTVQTWRPVGEQIRPRSNIPVHEYADVLGNPLSPLDGGTKQLSVSRQI